MNDHIHLDLVGLDIHLDLVGLEFTAHAGARSRRRPNFSETPPPSHLATADKPVLLPFMLIKNL